MRFRRNRRIRRLAVLSVGVSATVGAALGLAACGGKDAPPTTKQSYGFVVGDRSNTKVPSIDELIDKLPLDLVPESKVAVFAVDGSNNGVELYNKPVEKTENQMDQAGVSSQVLSDIRGALEEAKPTAPEANTLGAIGSAANALRDTDGNKTLVVADSMLSTAGVLQFQTGLLDASPEDVVASVNKEELPDLSGIDVQVHGLGEVRSPQGDLTESKRKKLESIWTSLLNEASAKSVTFHSQLGEDADVTGLPPVTVVQISQIAPALLSPNTCQQVLTETLIQFVPDTADFADPTVAKQTIAEAAASLKGCPGSITVTGTTSSWGSPEGREQTSQDRAGRVRDELAVALGVSPSTIVATGVGMEFPEYINDRDPSGRLIPAEAAKNRTVRIVAA